VTPGERESPMFTEDELLPISALQHLVFCERQCALIHLEGQWAENRLTVEGDQLHERVHEDRGAEARGDLRIVRGLTLRSFRLGLVGIADVVEFRPAGQADAGGGLVSLPGWDGRWRALPVEYKRGRPKSDICDTVQVGAQAMCLEEMLGGTVAEGALFYASVRRRTPVVVDTALRVAVETAAGRLHGLIRARLTPRARYEKKCDNCSLVEVCMPGLGTRRRSVRDYLARAAPDD
jgi:CRISPR-associated exonuclease Cas4